MKFNEDSRVKIPCILHLVQLGYEYLPLSGANWDEDTNIFEEIFKTAAANINPDVDMADICRQLDEVKLSLDNDDLGKAFYEKLTKRSGFKLIDFDNFDQNSFHVVTELTCKNGDDEFRPDITLLINGLPLAFIEVKKPNNREGVIAERKRMVTRSKNKKFKRFFNITQLMVFSNNMEYDDESPEPVEGAFYASTSYEKPNFNYFREDPEVEVLDLNQLLSLRDEAVENLVLKDNNLSSIKGSAEFQTNKTPTSPTNRICTSLFSRERFAFILKYAFAYVQKEAGLQKHVMRYPQLFATKAIGIKLDEDVKKGIIWHTQGSGKTALAYFNVPYLTHHYARKGIIPKFYFIVDRLDLLTQAQGEFSSRGLEVRVISSKSDFAKSIKETGAIHNASGRPEITVVNIQKFADDPDVAKNSDYNLKVQRIYFLDEVHRSYNPKGSFLANLTESDPNAIKIGLTGTPLLSDKHKKHDDKKHDDKKHSNNKKHSSKVIFGNYIHKYYYNASIADGYTLRLIREAIETSYQMEMKTALEQIKVLEGEMGRKELYSHKKFVKPMLDYIVSDFEKSRAIFGDPTIGGMVICDSAEQARELFKQFQAREEPEDKDDKNKLRTAALILHNSGSNKEVKDWRDKFKSGHIDLLFVFKMLLTGFDAPRLKKLYLGRTIRTHNLLQALTRVNRTYNDFRYGYVVDFADISKEFDKTNQAYFDELQAELGDEFEQYSSLFKSVEEIASEIEHIKDALFKYDVENAEAFSQQVSEMQDRGEVQELKRVLVDARNLYNTIRLQGEYDFLDQVDFKKLNILLRDVSAHLDLLNQKEALENQTDTSGLLNIALEDIIFTFRKLKEEELVIADKLKNALRQ
ncbi:MAG: type I restriction endonuclease subunit R, partial [Deltaproteobacteria bacterium]|nr:type I restriction endonuclease subunit R [Deltaproteobacteria bacterium]